MDSNTFDPSNLYRRNLLVVCMLYLIFFFAEGRVASDSLTFGLIGIELGRPEALYGFALLLLIWTGVRYCQEVEYKDVFSSALNEATCRSINTGRLSRRLLRRWIDRMYGKGVLAKISPEWSEGTLKLQVFDGRGATYDELVHNPLKVVSIFAVSLSKLDMLLVFEQIGSHEDQSVQFRVKAGWELSVLLQIFGVIESLKRSETLFTQGVCAVIYGVTLSIYLSLLII